MVTFLGTNLINTIGKNKNILYYPQLKCCVAQLVSFYGILVKHFYTCQLFPRYKREIFILTVLGILNTTRSFPKIPKEVRSLTKKSEDFRSLSTRINSSLLPVLFPKTQRSRGGYCHLFILHMVFVPYMGLSLHIFGNCVKQDGNNSHFSIRREKLARKREPA